MDNSKFSLTSIISLIGVYASYLLPLFLDGKLTDREILIITFFSSALCLTVFFTTVSSTLNKFFYKIKCLQNSQEVSELRLSILKDESNYLREETAHLRTLVQDSQQEDI